MNTELTQSFFAKVDEQIDLLQRLIPKIPSGKLEWRPIENSFRICDLLGHLLETLSGLCAVLYASCPEPLSHFLKLRELQVNHPCGIEEAQLRITQYAASIAEGSALLNDTDLSAIIPTVFTKNGETVLTILLGNLEHLINHKHQLYFYLKLLHVPISSEDLYHFRRD